MIGAVIAACDCGWTDTTRYPTAGPIDEEGEDLALAEWETHAVPALQTAGQRQREKLADRLRALGTVHANALADEAFSNRPTDQRKPPLYVIAAQVRRALALADERRLSVQPEGR